MFPPLLFRIILNKAIFLHIFVIYSNIALYLLCQRTKLTKVMKNNATQLPKTSITMEALIQGVEKHFNTEANKVSVELDGNHSAYQEDYLVIIDGLVNISFDLQASLTISESKGNYNVPAMTNTESEQVLIYNMSVNCDETGESIWINLKTIMQLEDILKENIEYI